MWRIDNLVIRGATLDFSSSEQGRFDVSQLFSGEELLINAIELVDWESDETQFLVCEACGYVGCKIGDWVSIRRSGSLILILPAFDSLLRNSVEYRPPAYIRKRGIGFLDLETYGELRNRKACFPAADSIRPLEVREAVKAFQWDAPFQVFGRPPLEFVHRSDLIIASSTGDHTDWIRRIEEIAQANQENSSAVTLRPVAGHEESVSLFLDTAEFVEWTALAVCKDIPHLMLGEYVVATNND